MISLDAAQAADMRMARCNRDMIKAETPLIVSLVKVFWNKMSEVATTHIKTISIIMKAHYSHTESVLLKIMSLFFSSSQFSGPLFTFLCFVQSNPIKYNSTGVQIVQIHLDTCFIHPPLEHILSLVIITISPPLALRWIGIIICFRIGIIVGLCHFSLLVNEVFWKCGRQAIGRLSISKDKSCLGLFIRQIGWLSNLFETISKHCQCVFAFGGGALERLSATLRTIDNRR